MIAIQLHSGRTDCGHAHQGRTRICVLMREELLHCSRAATASEPGSVRPVAVVVCAAKQRMYGAAPLDALQHVCQIQRDRHVA